MSPPQFLRPEVQPPVVALLRETRTNRYSLNSLTGILDACGTPWVTAHSLGDLLEAGREALRSGIRVLVGYSFMTPDLPSVRGEVRRVRRALPRAVLIAGGAHATADPEGTAALGFHHVFTGWVEATLPAFLREGAEGPTVLGDAGRASPSWETSPPFGRGRFGPLEITRGCSWACAFCAVGRRPVRHRSPSSILAAGARLLESGRRKLLFITPDALSYGNDLGEVEGLLDQLVSAGLTPVLGTFPSEVRPERVTREALRMIARYCANRTVVIGAQSGSDAVLRRLGRGHSVDDVVRASLVAREEGFRPHLDLIFGLPEESLEERRTTLSLARELRRKAGARIHAHYFHPLPGTPLWGREPSPLDEETRRHLLDLRKGGAEDGFWEEQERWSWEILDWARRGWIRTPIAESTARTPDTPVDRAV